MLPIDKNIPIPKVVMDVRHRFPVGLLKVGESFMVPHLEGKKKCTQSIANWRHNAKSAKEKVDRLRTTFHIASVGKDQWRCWRVS